MKLEDIIAADAAFMHNVTVTLDRRFPTVTIADDEGVQEDIFMQDSDAEIFSDAFDALTEQCPTANYGDIEAHLAKPYVEAFWS